MRHRLDPEIVKRAGLTAKQLEALELYDPGNFGYRSVAMALDISMGAAHDRIREGIRKLEKAMREPDKREK